MERLLGTETALHGSPINTRRDVPNVACGIHDPAYAITPHLILRRQEDDRPCSHRSVHHRIHIVDVNVNDNWRASVSAWRAAFQVRKFTVNHEHSTARLQCRVHHRAILGGSARQLPRAEYGTAELDL